MADQRPCPLCAYLDDGSAPDCTCKWPTVRNRNMTGHDPDCPMHAWRLTRMRRS